MPIISIEEFRDMGFIQEINRRFLHPLGYSIVVSEDEWGKVEFADMIFKTDDPEGTIFPDAMLNSDGGLEKVARIQSMIEESIDVRMYGMGFYVQPIEPRDDGG